METMSINFIFPLKQPFEKKPLMKTDLCSLKIQYYTHFC